MKKSFIFLLFIVLFSACKSYNAPEVLSPAHDMYKTWYNQSYTSLFMFTDRVFEYNKLIEAGQTDDLFMYSNWIFQGTEHTLSDTAAHWLVYDYGEQYIGSVKYLADSLWLLEYGLNMDSAYLEQTLRNHRTVYRMQARLNADGRYSLSGTGVFKVFDGSAVVWYTLQDALFTSDFYYLVDGKLTLQAILSHPEGKEVEYSYLFSPNGVHLAEN